jgi:hypothetical protein
VRGKAMLLSGGGESGASGKSGAGHSMENVNDGLGKIL